MAVCAGCSGSFPASAELFSPASGSSPGRHEGSLSFTSPPEEDRPRGARSSNPASSGSGPVSAGCLFDLSCAMFSPRSCGGRFAAEVDQEERSPPRKRNGAFSAGKWELSESIKDAVPASSPSDLTIWLRRVVVSIRAYNEIQASPRRRRVCAFRPLPRYTRIATTR